jgi:hypothetical protein
MYLSKAALASSILGMFVLIASTASAQNCGCVDAANPAVLRGRGRPMLGGLEPLQKSHC